MPSITIGDQTVPVSDNFMSLSPEQQHATVDEIAKSLPQKQSQGSGIGEFFKSIPTGLARTAAGFARGEQIESEQRASAFTDKPNVGPEIPTGENVEKTFGLHKPEGFGGTAGELAGEYIANPATYFGPGSAIGKFLTTAASVFGAAGGKELTKGTALEPYGEVGGAVAGGFVPSTVLKAAQPVLINQARQAAAQVLAKEGVTAITAGQETGSKALEYTEGFLGDALFAGGKASEARDVAGRQFTRAALKRVGENSDLATPQVIDRAFTRIGGQMDQLAARTTVPVDPPLIGKLRAARDEYNSTVPQGTRRSIVDDLFNDFQGKAVSPGSPGFLDGNKVQRLRSRLTRLQRGAYNDPEYSELLGGYVEALDDAIERAMPKATVQAWQQARRQYRNLIPLAKASVGAGEQAAEGIITPQRLRSALTSDQRGKRDYARGRGDYAALTHAGNFVMTPLPNSGTAQREMAHAFAASLGAAAGYAFGGGAEQGVTGAAAGAMAGPGLLGRVLMSKPVQSYLAGRLPGQAAARQARAALPSNKATLVRSAAPVLSAPDLYQSQQLPELGQ